MNPFEDKVEATSPEEGGGFFNRLSSIFSFGSKPKEDPEIKEKHPDIVVHKFSESQVGE